MGHRLNANGKNPVEVVRCPGDLNADRMVTIKNRLNRLMNQNHRFFLIDMEDASGVDVAGIGILVDRVQKIRSLRGDIRLFNTSPEVRETFRQVGVDAFIGSYENEEEALKSFQPV